MTSHLYPGVLVTAMIIAGALALGYTGFAAAGHDVLIAEPVIYWLVFAGSFGLLLRNDRRAALMTMSALFVLTTFVLVLIGGASAADGLGAFTAVVGFIAVGSTTIAVRDELRARNQPNPLRDAAETDESIFECGGVQYHAWLSPSASAPELRVEVLLQNCCDTAATAHVQLEEDVVNAPGVALPTPTTVELAPQGWAALELRCPALEGHRGEGWFHLSMRVERAERGQRVLLWRAEAGPGSLRATQLTTAMFGKSRQYLGTRILLPDAPPTGRVGDARTTVTALSRDELARFLRERAATS